MNTEQVIPKFCMLDIETFDTAPTAKILSLGAVDVYGNASWYKEFSHFQYGRTSSPSTEDWWKFQETKVPEGTVYLEQGLIIFKEWYQQQGFTEVWCKGSDFDFVILSNAYQNIKEKDSVESIGTPWKYNQVRDLRTLIKLFPEIKSPAPWGNHNALVDAICQAQHLKELLKYVRRLEAKRISRVPNVPAPTN